MVALKRKSIAELRDELERLPEHLTGEVIDGELHVMGRPSQAHQTVEGELFSNLRRGGGGGPPAAGWRFMIEVAVTFPSGELVVPDVAGWRSEHLAGHEAENPVTVRPDWVCEVLSPSTRLKDLGPKRSLYARQGVPHLWVVDPEARTLEAFELAKDRWMLLGTWGDAGAASGVAPFPSLTLDLAGWWL